MRIHFNFSWIEWAKRLKYLKLVNTDVPDWIFPKNCSGELIDAKVFSARGPDDSIYDTYTLVRDRVRATYYLYFFYLMKYKFINFNIHSNSP